MLKIFKKSISAGNALCHVKKRMYFCTRFRLENRAKKIT